MIGLMKKILLTVLIILVFSGLSFSEESVNYTPYNQSEFPQWAQDLRRFEVVFFGTIPFSFLYSSTGYSIYTYASHNWDSSYAPALLGNKTPPVLTTDDKLQVLTIALGVSATAAFVDFILGKINHE